MLDETNTDTKILVLARQDGHPDSFPIWIGAAEGHAIKLALDTTLTPRPMSHDLVKSFMEHLNVSVRRVVIGDVKNSTYYATVYLENNGVERTVDAGRAMPSHWPCAPERHCMSAKMCWPGATPPISSHGWPNRIRAAVSSRKCENRDLQIAL